MSSPLRTAAQRVSRSPFPRILTAFLAFNVAELAVWIALLVWAFDRGGVDAASGIAIAQLAPAVLAAPLAATLGDRGRRGRVLAIGYGTQAVTMSVTALALATDQPFGVVAVCGAAVTSAVTMTRPVHNSLLPEVSSDPAQLTAANAASSAAEAAALLLGPAAGGLLIAAWGAESVFAVMAAAMALAAAATAGLQTPARSRRTSGGRLVGDAAEGVRELVREPSAAVLLGMVCGQFVVMGMLDILTVVLALDVLGTDSSGPGLLISAVGAGSLLGAMATSTLIGRSRLTPALALGIVLTGVPLVLIAGTTALAPALSLLLLSGAGKSFFDVAGRTLLQRTVRDDVLTRIFGVQEALLTAGLAAGAVVAPVLVKVFGDRGCFVAAGVFLPLIGAVAWLQMRKLDDLAELPGPAFDLLRALPIFALLPLRQLESVSRSVRPVTVAAGALVLAEGDHGRDFFLIASGTVVVSQRGQQIRTMGPGEAFGEIALLRDVPRTATVVAETDVHLQALDRDVFLATVTGDARIRSAAEEVTDQHLRDDATRD